MYTAESLGQLIAGSGLSNFGDVYLFGSFIRTNGDKYNDIDIYIDTDEPSLDNLRKVLDNLPFKVHLTPRYGPGPIPPPPPPWPLSPKLPFSNFDEVFINNEVRSPLLHVTACPRSSAMKQPFFKTLFSGPYIKITRKRL